VRRRSRAHHAVCLLCLGLLAAYPRTPSGVGCRPPPGENSSTSWRTSRSCSTAPSTSSGLPSPGRKRRTSWSFPPADDDHRKTFGTTRSSTGAGGGSPIRSSVFDQRGPREGRSSEDRPRPRRFSSPRRGIRWSSPGRCRTTWSRPLVKARGHVKNVTNLLRVQKVEQVLLQVRVSEIDRSLGGELGSTSCSRGTLLEASPAGQLQYHRWRPTARFSA